jgi:hypothetical protein
MSNEAVAFQNILRRKVAKYTINNSRITPTYLDDILIEAQQLFMEISTDLAQVDRRVEEDIRPLRENDYKLEFVRNEDTYTIYALPSNYFRDNICYGKIACAECPEKKLKLFKAKANEETNLLQDYNWKPSWEWGSSFYVLVKDGIKVYHNGEFEIRGLYLDYYRKPVEWRTASNSINGSYVSSDQVLINQDYVSELTQNYQLRRLSDIAAVMIERDFNQEQQWQSKVSAILSLENLYK